MKVRTRFAPSPTGFMHIGNLRTALYSYLFAKHNGGDFILRIEDTDEKRYVEGAVDLIYRTLRTSGITPDEGPGIGGDVGPYIQSQRKEIYAEYAKKLIELGGAYYCFCSKERLETLTDGAGNHKYDKHCLKLSKEERKERLRDLLAIAQLTEYEHYYVHEISGGMKQRVALLRALACEPKILLMDEPLGAVDFQMRQMLQKQLESILQQKKVTSLMVTHDVDESVYLSDRVIVMSRDHGKIMEDLKIDLPRPRDRTAPKYHEYVDKLTNILKTALNGAVYTQEDKDIMEFIHRTEEIEEGVAERLKKG